MQDLEELKGFTPQGKNNDLSHPDTPKLTGTEPSTKGYIWFQAKMWHRNALLGISCRSGLWSGKGSIEAPKKGNRQRWGGGGSVSGRGAYTWRQWVGGGVGNLWGGSFWEGRNWERFYHPQCK